MPELPEVETIRRGLEPRLVGRVIVAVETSGVPLRKASPLPLGRLVGRRVVALRRHAKVMFWRLDVGTVVVHLGMTGKWLFAQPGEVVVPHTHVRLWLDDEQELRYVDVRRFGWVAYHGDGAGPQDAAHYGIDALDPAFDEAHLAALLSQSRAPLKAFLLDQTKVAGLGNIYACEALWRARLSPRRLACNTPRSRVPLLRDAMVAVLQDSLAQGGTSFNDYVNSIGEPGEFIADLAVFQRAGAACPRCGGVVRQFAQAGRSTFYCPGCQR